MTITLILTILWPLLGALARRIMGGFLNWPRGLTYYQYTPLVALPAGWACARYDLSSWWAVAISLVALALVMILLIRGLVAGPIDKPTRLQIFKKYGPFGIGYWLAWKYWPADWKLGGFITGADAVGELSLGFLLFFPFGLLWSI